MIKKIYKTLLSHYGPQGWWPIKGKYKEDHKHKPRSSLQKFEIMVGAILTQNTSWSNVEKALTQLRKDVLKITPLAIDRTPEHKLAQSIKSSGYHNQKARKLKALVNFLNTNKKISRDNLLTIWGVGPETADSILLYAYNHPTFVIDTYTKRVFNRLGITKETDYHKLQEMFHNSLKPDHKLFNEFHALLVQHAKEHCKSKPVCANCPLENQCKKNF